MDDKNTYLPTQQTSTLEQDIYNCFCNKPRRLPPKYFYDDEGSKLFDQICETPEYYVTRTEEKLLIDSADELISLVKPEHIIEFGSGTSRKTRILLDSCERNGHYCTYWPMEVCPEIVESAEQDLKIHYPWLKVNPIIGDFHADFDCIPLPEGRKLALFLGSTIGNLDQDEATEFLIKIRCLLAVDDQLLLGADRVKDKYILEAAYNDQSGITAKFNLNLLQVLNRELNADFIFENFSHSAVYNGEKHRMESYLVSNVSQLVYFKDLDLKINLRSGERILTELSRKFTPDSLQNLVYESGYSMVNHFSADNDYFSLLLMRATV